MFTPDHGSRSNSSKEIVMSFRLTLDLLLVPGRPVDLSPRLQDSHLRDWSSFPDSCPFCPSLVSWDRGDRS